MLDKRNGFIGEGFVQRLREAIRDRYGTRGQRKFSREVGIDPRLVSQYTTGHALPMLPTLVRMVEVLGVTADYLLMGVEPKRSDMRQRAALPEWQADIVRQLEAFPEDKQQKACFLIAILASGQSPLNAHVEHTLKNIENIIDAGIEFWQSNVRSAAPRIPATTRE